MFCKFSPGICKKRELVYCIECAECKGEFKYVGETSRSLGERFLEHFKNLDDSNSTFYDHKVNIHEGQDLKFKFNVNIINSHTGDPMRRQVAEGVCIDELKPLLNRKDEWSTGRLIIRTQQP